MNRNKHKWRGQDKYTNSARIQGINWKIGGNSFTLSAWLAASITIDNTNKRNFKILNGKKG